MPKTLIEAFIETATRMPDRPALYYFDTEWQYQELFDRVERAAGGLQRLGVGPGDRVGLMLQNVPSSVVLHFAVWALGASVVPMNIMMTPAELAHQITGADVRILAAMTSVAERVKTLGDACPSLSRVIVVDDREDFLGVPPSWLPLPSPTPSDTVNFRELLEERPLPSRDFAPVNPSDLALLTYTSGTTGVPKGAMNTHGQMLHNVHVYQTLAQVDNTTVNVAFAPLFHITGAVASLATAITIGQPLVLMYRFDAAVAAEAIQRRRASFTVGAITTYLALLKLPTLDDFDLSSLTHAYSGGAPVAPATVRAFTERTGITIHNVYGLTESANGLIMVPWGAEAPTDPLSGALSIGVPGDGIQASIRDLAHPEAPLPSGQLGELALQGPSLITGYWNNPEANQVSFVDGWFLTGDVARMTDDGWIFIVDRKKDVIISAGNNVWPRDVEDALYQHPGVAEAVVVGQPDPYRGEVVTAYVVRSSEGSDLTEAALNTFLRQYLSAYKVPRHIHWVDAIPKTASGKFLRRAFRPTEPDK